MKNKSKNRWIIKIKQQQIILLESIMVSNRATFELKIVSKGTIFPGKTQGTFHDRDMKRIGIIKPDGMMRSIDGTETFLYKHQYRKLYPKEKRKIIYNLFHIAFIDLKTKKTIKIEKGNIGRIIEGYPDSRVKVLFFSIDQPKSWRSKIWPEIIFYLSLFNNAIKEHSMKENLSIWLDAHDYDYIPSKKLKELIKGLKNMPIKDTGFQIR